MNEHENTSILETQYKKASTKLGEVMAGESLLKWQKQANNLSPPAKKSFVVCSPTIQLRLAPGQFERWGALAVEIDAKSSELAKSYIETVLGLLDLLLPRHLEDFGRKCLLIYHCSGNKNEVALQYLLSSKDYLKNDDYRSFALVGELLSVVAKTDLKLAKVLTCSLSDLLGKCSYSPHAFLISMSGLAKKDTRLVGQVINGLLDLSKRQLKEPLMLMLASFGDHSPEALKVAKKIINLNQQKYPSAFFELVSESTKQDKETALALLKSYLNKLYLLEYEEIQTWLKMKDKSTQLSWNKVATKSSKEALKKVTSTIRLTRSNELLEPYSSAMLQSKTALFGNEKASFLPIKPVTNGKKLYLPPLSNQTMSKKENFDAYKVCITLFATSFELDAFKWDFSTPSKELFDLRFFVAKVAGAKGFTEYTLFSDLELAKELYLVFENARIKATFCRRYQGLSNAYKCMLIKALKKRPSTKLLNRKSALIEAIFKTVLGEERVLVDSRDEKTLLKLCALLQTSCGTSNAALAVEQTIRAYVLVGSIEDPGDPEDPEDTEKKAGFVELKTTGHKYHETKEEIESYKRFLLKQLQKNEPKEDEKRTPLDTKDEKDKKEDTNEKEDFGDQNTEDIGETSYSEYGMGVATSKDDLSLSFGQTSNANDYPISAKAELQLVDDPAQNTSAGSLDDTKIKDEDSVTLYGEWDDILGVYRDRWCAVRESRVVDGDESYFSRVYTAHKSTALSIKRKFELLTPELTRRNKIDSYGDDVDLDKAVEALIDIKSNVTPREDIYKRNTKFERSVGVAFLLDVSASTAETVEVQDVLGGGSVKKRIIDIEKESIVLLINALESLGDVYGIYAFSGYGRENVQFYVLKEMDEKVSMDVVGGRLSNLAPTHATRMGAAIRHATDKLMKVETRTRHLFLISDGRPQDRDYSRDGNQRDYAIGDTRRALEEAKRGHIVPFCLTVDKRGSDYLEEMSGTIAYGVVPDVISLPTKLATFYRRATT